MKFTTAIIFAFTAASATAFTTPTYSSSRSAFALRMVAEDDVPAVVDNNMPTPVPAKSNAMVMSQALPFLARPAALDGSLVGDVGFDPLGFAKTKSDLLNNREAEIKHGRLAMLVRPSSSVLFSNVKFLFLTI
jgi:Chlorophyll A-B binding protein